MVTLPINTVKLLDPNCTLNLELQVVFLLVNLVNTPRVTPVGLIGRKGDARVRLSTLVRFILVAADLQWHHRLLVFSSSFWYSMLVQAIFTSLQSSYSQTPWEDSVLKLELSYGTPSFNGAHRLNYGLPSFFLRLKILLKFSYYCTHILSRILVGLPDVSGLRNSSPRANSKEKPKNSNELQ
jgi:hypothetical protein